MKAKLFYLFAISLLLITGCNPTPDISKSALDSGLISYVIPDSLHRHLLSEYLPTPSEAQKNTPVLIAVHGYSATTFEWDECRAFADQKKTFYVSQVLLGGHGRSYQSFKQATWQNWQSSIAEEYRKLDSIGYRHIFLAGSSTGASLILNLIKKGFFEGQTLPKGIFLIDPIIIPSNKTLTMVGLMGPVLGYVTTNLTNGEMERWYLYRPQESLQQLMQLIDLTRRDLQKGFTLPAGTTLKVYKSIKDDNADPVSALLIYKGLKMANGKPIDVEMVDSKLHVFTRLSGREGVTATDIQLQQRVFAEMESRMTE